MKIAGTTFDTEEGEEIEDIVKVFFIARRMKSLPYQGKVRRKSKKAALEILKETNVYHDFKQGKFSLFSVRGLN